MPVRKESVKDRLERDYLYHYGKKESGCVLCGSFPRQGDTSKWYDYSPYANHGTITGATWVRLPSGLWVNRFDGTDDLIDCGSGASLDIPTTISVKCWVYPLTLGEANYGSIFRPDGDPFYLVMWGDTNVRFLVEGLVVGSKTVNTNNGSVPVNKWTFLVATYNGATQQIYVNGVIQTDVNTWAAAMASLGAGSLIIGNRTAGDLTFDGDIGLIGIFNRALSATEIATIYYNERHLFGV
jgi:hypothetical protein